MTIPSSFTATSIPSDDWPDLGVREREPRGARSYILVVDDEEVVRRFLARCLKAEGYAVRDAAGAAEALELIMSESPAAVLCDIRLPDQDGLWLAERIHRHWPQIPIVMATAVDDLDTVRKSRDLGAVDYIAKPFQAHQVVEVLRRVTARQAEADPEAEEASPPDPRQPEHTIEAEYTLETPVRCPACGERVAALKAVRLIRARVNFTSTLPRRGRVIVCPHCLGIVAAELSNF